VITSWTPRRVAWLCLAGVSVIAGLISYYHGLMVVSAAPAGWLAHWIVNHAEPALADLVITGASANLLDAYRHRGEDGRLPRLSMLSAGIGAAVTLYFNVAAGHPAWVPRPVVNGWPPVAFGLALESLLGLIRRGRGGGSLTAVPAAPGQDEPGGPLTAEAALAQLVDAGTRRAVADLLGVPKSRVDGWAARFAQPVDERVGEPAGAGLNGDGTHE